MTSDSGYWSRTGRHRPASGEFGEDGYDEAGHNGHGDPYQDTGSHRRPAWHDAQDGQGWSDGYAGSPGYGQQESYGGSEPYGGASGYGEAGYGDPSYADPSGYPDGAGYSAGSGYTDGPGYGDHAGYADPLSYGGDAGYGAAGYGDQGGYGQPGGYGDRAGYSESAGYGDQDGYAGYGAAEYGAAGYGEQSGYPAAAGYQEADDYGTGQPSRGRHSADSGGHDPYGYQQPYGGAGEPGYEQQATSGYQWQDQYGHTDPLTGSFRAGDTGSFDEASSHGGADTGSHSWAFTPGSHGYDAGPDQAAEPYPGEVTGGFGAADSGTFGRPDTGSFRRPDTGSFGRPDTGSFGRPDTGSFDLADSSRFARPDTGSFRRADSGAFGRPDTGSFDRDGEFDPDSDHDSGSLRWTSGPPELRSRADRDGADDALSGRGAGDLAGRPDWRDEPADDWQDDEDGLLSRRFGRAGDAPEPVAGGRGKVRGRKRRRFRGKAAFTAAIAVVVFILGVSGAFGYRYVHSWITNRYGDYSGPGTGTVQITVTSGATLAGLGPTLVRQGVVMSLRPYETAAAAATGILQPGVYKLHHHMNSALAVKLLLGSKARVKIQAVIIEGTRASKVAAELAAVTGLKASAFQQIIDNPPAALGLPSWAKGSSAEGFLFPDTYTFLPHESALQILKAMVREFNQKVDSISIESNAAKVFTTPWHVLIVASMIQAEAGSLADMPKISRVAWNRLKLGLPLQFDSTVFYAMNKYGTHVNAQQEKFPSPYNTYQHTGLPPGPIGNPGLDAIKAALHPVKADYLYFITDTRKKPYVTHFTNSLKQLQRWQQEFQG
ncbi:MAG TPA: endolytic transglycosylase MltG [Streptosporangiaceae bacterium]